MEAEAWPHERYRFVFASWCLKDAPWGQKMRALGMDRRECAREAWSGQLSVHVAWEAQTMISGLVRSASRPVLPSVTAFILTGPSLPGQCTAHARDRSADRSRAEPRGAVCFLWHLSVSLGGAGTTQHVLGRMDGLTDGQTGGYIYIGRQRDGRHMDRRVDI